MSTTFPAMYLGGADCEAAALDLDSLDRLLHALAGSITAALAHVAAARRVHVTDVDHEEHLRGAVVGARTRLELTAREADVLTLLASGLTNREIAARLVISVRTAEHHVAHILRKLRAPNRRVAAALARELALPGVAGPRHLRAA